MTIYYVSTIGNNLNNGLTENTSWRNIWYASQYVIAGDEVRILPGNYIDDYFLLYNSGTSDVNRIKFIGYNGVPVLSNISQNIDNAISNYPYDNEGTNPLSKKNYITISNLKIEGYIHGLRYVYGTNWYISNIEFSNQYMGMYPSFIYSIVEDCIAHDVGWVGFKMGWGQTPSLLDPRGTNHCIYRRLEAYNCYHNGIDCSSSYENTFEDCNSHNNLNNGYYPTNWSERLTFINCISQDNTDVGFRLQSCRDSTLIGCISKNNGRSGYESSFDSWTTQEIKNNKFIDCISESNRENYYITSGSGHNIIRCSSLTPTSGTDYMIEGNSTYPVINLLIQNLPNGSYNIYILPTGCSGKIESTLKQTMTHNSIILPHATCDPISCYIDFNVPNIYHNFILNLSGGTCPQPSCNLLVT